MGRQSFFITFNTTDRDEVARLWNQYVISDQQNQYDYAVQLLEEEDRSIDDTAIYEIAIYNGSPLSFDDYKYVFVDPPLEIQNEIQLCNWILDNHQKWDPAYAVPFKGKTMIGGWVSV